MIKRHLIMIALLTALMVIILMLMMLSGPRMHHDSPVIEKEEIMIVDANTR